MLASLMVVAGAGFTISWVMLLAGTPRSPGAEHLSAAARRLQGLRLRTCQPPCLFVRWHCALLCCCTAGHAVCWSPDRETYSCYLWSRARSLAAVSLGLVLACFVTKFCLEQALVASTTAVQVPRVWALAEGQSGQMLHRECLVPNYEWCSVCLFARDRQG